MLAQQLNTFMQGLLARDATASPAAALIDGGEFTPQERLAIYRNNLRENFLKLMELEYPVIRRLVGAEFFGQRVRQYLLETPSRSGDLFHAGRGFARFLRQEFGGGDYAYLPDVAELEWAFQEAMIAPDSSAVFDTAGLATVAPEDYELLRLEAHPAVRLVASPYPIVTIWAANQPDSAATETIDLARGGEHALLLRPQRSTSISAIAPAAGCFLQAVLRGEPLGVALDQALQVDPGFALEAALAAWIQHRALVGWSLG